MAAVRFRSDDDSKDEKPSTSLVLKRLSSPSQKTDSTVAQTFFQKFQSFLQYLTGCPLNPHIPIPSDRGILLVLSACFEETGVSTTATHYFALAKKSGLGIAQTWFAFNPVMLITRPSLVQQVIYNKAHLVSKETGVDIQANFFGEDTIITLRTSDERYGPARASLMHHLFNRIHELGKPIHNSLNFYLNEIDEAAKFERSIDLQDLSRRIAISLISETQLGLNVFPEKYKSRFAKIIHEIVTSAPNPFYMGLITAEQMIYQSIKWKPNLARKLNAFAKNGEKLLDTVIDFNEKTALQSLSSISGDKNLQADDLIKPKIMSLIKLFLVGGFETTSKTIFFLLLMLADPENQKFIEKMLEEIESKKFKKVEEVYVNAAKKLEMIEKKIQSPEEKALEIMKLNQETEEKLQQTAIEHWTVDDLDELEYLRAFIFEVLRLFPPFSYLRHKSEEPFSFAQNIGLSKTKTEYDEKFNDPTRDTRSDIQVPAGTSILTSTYDAHRDPELYGEDATEFKPSRWLGKKFSLRNAPSHYNFYTFGGQDRRVCPGRLLAFIEALSLIARLACKYEVLSSLRKPFPLDVGFTLELSRGYKAMGMFVPRHTEIKKEAEFASPKRALK